MSVPQTLAAMVFIFAATQSASAEDRFFDSNGVRIRYVVEGQGEPLALVPGKRVVVVEGATHGPPGDRGIIRRPELLEHVRQFVDAHKAP